MKTFLGVLLVGLMACPVSVRAATGLPFSDGFESGSFSGWAGGGANGFSVSSADHYSGAYAARGVSVLGQLTDYYQDRPFGDHPQVNGIPAAGGVYFKFAHKYGAGFDLGRTQNYNKVLLMNFEDAASVRRDQVILNTAVMYSNESRRGQYLFELTHWNPDGSWNSGSLALQNQGAPVTYREGQWDVIKIYVLPNTVGQSNGQLRMWVNGVLKADHSNVQIRFTSCNLNLAIIGSYVTATDVAGTRWWDDVAISETDPDGPGSVKQVSPPSIQSVNPLQ